MKYEVMELRPILNSFGPTEMAWYPKGSYDVLAEAEQAALNRTKKWPGIPVAVFSKVATVKVTTHVERQLQKV